MPLVAQVSPALEGGSAYQVGDTGTVNAGDNAGAYTVLTVDAFSRALTVSVAGGTGYTDQGSVSTTATTGIGFSLNIHIIASGGALVSAIVRNPWAGYAYAPGDQGTVQGGGVGDGTAVYTVSTVDAYGQVLTLTATGGTGYWNGNVPTFQAMSTTTVTTGAGDGGLTLQYSASQTSPTPGSVYAAQVQANEGGANYQVGDGPGTISQTGSTAQYTVTAIDMFGSVTAVSVGGDLTGYVARNNNTTSPGGTGGDGLLRVDLYESSPPLPGISCGTPPTGDVFNPYTTTFPTTGGTTPYSFSIISGSLPPGISLNPSTGTASGTPTSPGTFPFTVQVTDANSNTASVSCSISIFSNGLCPIPEGPSLLHSIRRLNDPDASEAPAGYIYVIGNSTVLDAGTETSLTQIDSGYSGNPLSLITFRPEQSPESFMYVYDALKQIKVRPDRVTRPVGVAPPTQGPLIDYGVPAWVEIHDGQTATSWLPTGIDTINGTPQDRTGGDIDTIGFFIYDEGTTGWCCIQSNSAQPAWWGNRMQIILNPGGGNQELVVVREVIGGISYIYTIAGIQYDSGTTGLASVVLAGGAGSAVVVRNQILQFVGGGGNDLVRVLSVTLSPDGTAYSIRVNLAHSHAAGDTVNSEQCWRAYTTLNHVDGETYQSNYVAFTHAAAGIGGGTYTPGSAINAAIANGRTVDPANDYLHISLYIAQIYNVVNVQILLSFDTTPNFNFTSPGNSFIFTVTAQDIIDGGLTGLGWIDLVLPLSSATQTGVADTLNLGNVKGIALQMTTAAGGSNWGFDWWYLFGTYGPVIQPNSPTGYLYQTVDRDSTTGAQSVPGPQARYDVFPLREAVVVTPESSIEAGVDSLDIYRQGGTLTGFVYVATVGNGIVNTVGTVVTWENGALFGIGLTGYITINGVPYPISSVNSDISITLSVSAGTQNGVPYTTTFTDGIPDTSLLGSPAVDLTKIQPWPLLDLPWAGIVNVVGTSVEWVSGTPFNVALLSATVISINGVDYQTYGQPRTTTFLEIFLDAGVQGDVPYLIASPTLAGQPLPYAFGPLEGPLAPVIFALGDPVSGGNLYWTNFSDGDSADDANFLELAPSSEPLVSGEVWNGIVIAGSRENIFLVRYSFITNSVYQFNRIPSPSGMWSRWTVCRGPDGVYYLGRDGVYRATEGESKNITDAQLYPLFPHDGQPAYAVNGYLPVNMAQINFMRMSALDNEIRFTYLDAACNQMTLRYEIARNRWFFHEYGDPISYEYLDEPSVNNPNSLRILQLSRGLGNIYVVGGNTDNNVEITSQAFIPYQDGGDERGQILPTDFIVDSDGTGVVTAQQFYNNGVNSASPSDFTVSGSRIQSILNVSNVPNILNLYRNLSVLLTWTGGPAGPRIYAIEPAWYKMPFLSTRVLTQFIPLDSPGTWLHIRRLYAGLISTSPITFTVTTQDGRVYSVVIPSTNGQFMIQEQMFLQNCKFLSAAFELDSNGVPFALFLESFAPEVKFWQQPSYLNLQIFKT